MGMEELQRRKVHLNAKIEQSLETVRRAATALEEYQTLYNRTVDRLQQQLNVPTGSTTAPDPFIPVDTTPIISGSRKRQPSDQSVQHSTTNQSHKRADNKEENSSSVRAFVALSSLTPIPAPLPSIPPRAASMPMSSRGAARPIPGPPRRLSSSTLATDPSSNTTRDPDHGFEAAHNAASLEENIRDAIDGVRAASQIVDHFNSVIADETKLIERQQENQTAFCLSFFRSAEKREAEEAAQKIHSCLTQKETINQQIIELREELSDVKSQGQTSDLRRGLNTFKAQMKDELQILESTIILNREIVTKRRQELAYRILYARKYLKQVHDEQSDRRTRRLLRSGAVDFLAEAKKEMKLLMSSLRNLPGSKSKRRRDKRRAKHAQGNKEEVDDELTQLTKRLKLK